MSNVKQLPIQLQKLGLMRFKKLYPQQHNIDSKIVTLLALSDFAWRSLESQPDLMPWLLCKSELQNRAIHSPFENWDLTELDESQCHKLLRKYREKYWLKVAFLDLCCNNPISNSIKYISQLADMLIQSANQWAHSHLLM